MFTDLDSEIRNENMIAASSTLQVVLPPLQVDRVVWAGEYIILLNSPDYHLMGALREGSLKMLKGRPNAEGYPTIPPRELPYWLAIHLKNNFNLQLGE